MESNEAVHCIQKDKKQEQEQKEQQEQEQQQQINSKNCR